MRSPHTLLIYWRICSKMTEYSFKSGIKIHIPDSIPKADRHEAWINAKMLMSVLFDWVPVEQKPRKPYTFSEENRKKILSRQSSKGQKAVTAKR